MTHERPRLILYPSNLDNLEKLARIARHVAAPDYEWPADGITFVATVREDGERLFAASARKNKNSITLWENKP